MLSELADYRYQNKFLSLFGKKLLNYIHFPEGDFFFLSMEDNKEHTWNKPTLNRSLSYAMLSEDTDFIKMNSFIHFAANFWKTFSFLKQDLKILSFFDLELKLKMLALFLSLKDNTEYMYILNQHWIGKHPMQCCPNKLIRISALS